MTVSSFRDLLIARASRADVIVEPPQIDQLEEYFSLLQRWNRTINLTALPLEPMTADAMDRLFIEPLAAAHVVRLRVLPVAKAPSPALIWFDLGSGGGSPALPMKIALSEPKLTMVESKSRKVAFLREVVRALDLRDVLVEEARVDELAKRMSSADLVTVRGVRLNDKLANAAGQLLRPNGILAAFQSFDLIRQIGWFSSEGFHHLVSDQPSWLHLYRRVASSAD